MFSIEFFCVILPLCGTFLGQALRSNRVLSHVVASAFTGISMVLAWYLFFAFKQNYNIEVMPWLQIGKTTIGWSIYVDRLTSVMLIVVSTVSFMVHLYSIGYMSSDAGAVRFFSYLSAFTFFMMVLVVSGNFLQLFFGWEGVGLCSYLLIGFWFKKDAANKSAMKAFIVNRVGDLFFLCGMFVVYHAFHSLEFSEILAKVTAGAHLGTVTILGHSVQVGTIACVLLFLGCMGKSAQIGLHTWLPDAMEGPTPASALIHAATMVTAGVFLVARSSPLFEISEASRNMVLIIGLGTCLFAAAIAVVQEDIKKIIAYSTCSQLGYMFIACGTSNYHLAIFHLATHAFFKSLLFLAAGNVIHSNEGEQRIGYMSRDCWRDIPFTYSLMLIGSLALMGIFPLSGFYSKDLIIESTYGDWPAFLVTNLVACLTSVYSCRLIFSVFHNSSNRRIPSIHDSKGMMLFPLLVLAFGAIFSGMWFKGFWDIEEGAFWASSLSVVEHKELGAFVALVPIIAATLGISAYMACGKVGFSKVRFVVLQKLLSNKLYFDELYDHVFVRPMRRVATAFWLVLDQKVIDYFVLGGITAVVSKCAGYSVKVQSGRVLDYVFVMLVGTVIAALVVVYGVKVQ